MEPIIGNEGEPRSSWFSLISKNRALCIFIQLKNGTSERSVFFKGALADFEPQGEEAGKNCLECCGRRRSLS